MAEDATENEEKSESSEQKETPKRKLPVLALLAGGQTFLSLALGGLVFYGLNALNTPSVTPEKMQERAIASVRDSVAQIQWMELDPFITNTVSKNTLKTSLSVEVSDAQTAQMLQSRMPAIRARVLTLLSQQNALSLRRMQDKLLLKDAIREALNLEIQKSGLKEGVVRDVYLVDFLII
jgi:flagellar basal body-associated protein FliL